MHVNVHDAEETTVSIPRSPPMIAEVIVVSARPRLLYVGLFIYLIFNIFNKFVIYFETIMVFSVSTKTMNLCAKRTGGRRSVGVYST